MDAAIKRCMISIHTTTQVVTYSSLQNPRSQRISIHTTTQVVTDVELYTEKKNPISIHTTTQVVTYKSTK